MKIKGSTGGSGSLRYDRYQKDNPEKRNKVTRMLLALGMEFDDIDCLEKFCSITQKNLDWAKSRKGDVIMEDFRIFREPAPQVVQVKGNVYFLPIRER